MDALYVEVTEMEPDSSLIGYVGSGSLVSVHRSRLEAFDAGPNPGISYFVVVQPTGLSVLERSWLDDRLVFLIRAQNNNTATRDAFGQLLYALCKGL